MKTKAFKAESKRLLDLMINSIYTNKEIFLRELISNASDAIDKLYFESLTDKKIKVKHDDFKIEIELDKDARTFTIKDNGCGMNAEELENNLGTIAKSGSLAFKEELDKKSDVDIIGQFGVGFYSSFMVSDEVTVISKPYGEAEANKWHSKGIDGYTIEPTQKDTYGTTIILKIKEDTDDEKYSDYLEEYKVTELVKKYSDYIRYPIEMEVTKSRPVEKKDDKNDKDDTENKEPEYETYKEVETLNSMVPIWKRKKSELKDKDYNDFYKDKFYDYDDPLLVIHTGVEGEVSYNAILYIPSHLPYDYYTKEYQKGLQLYSNGVLIMDKCEDLLPDYYGFVKGLVDSPDLSLNISREMLQHDRQLRVIAKNIEKKIKSELLNMQKKDREKYNGFFEIFGTQLKYGTYNDYGNNKDELKDLLMFYSSTEKGLVTLDEYVSRMKEDQKNIYYACGESIDKIDMLPQVEGVKDKYEILYLTEDIDEFVMQTLMEYKEKSFLNVSAESTNLDTDDEKEALEKENEDNKDMLNLMKEALGDDVEEVKFTNRLKNHPVCLTNEGAVSSQMEKTLNQMPNNNNIKAQMALEINKDHKIAQKLKDLYKTDKDELKNYAKILYSEAKLIEGLEVDNPTEISNLICDIISK